MISLAFATALLASGIVHAAPAVVLRRQAPPPANGLGSNQVIPVVVGGQQDLFMPNVVTAGVGDILQFQFANGNHTVTQSAEGAACTPLLGGVHSGHIPFQDGQTTVGTFLVPVTSAEPMFIYCATGPHCQEGQVLVVNPSTPAQVVNYAKLSSAAANNIDGSAVSGGFVSQIQLADAAFIPAPPAAPPGGGGGGGGGAGQPGAAPVPEGAPPVAAPPPPASSSAVPVPVPVPAPAPADPSLAPPADAAPPADEAPPADAVPAAPAS